MKQLKLSWIGLFALAFFTLLSCQKDISGLPELTSAAKGGPTTPPSVEPAFDLALPDVDVTCATNTEYCFNTSLLNRGGNLVGGNVTINAVMQQFNVLLNTYETIYTSATLSENQGSVCFSGLQLTAGAYKVVVTYKHANGNADPQTGSFEFPLTVKAEGDCGTSSCEVSGLTFTRTPVLVLNAAMQPIQADVTYTVSNCTSNETFTNLKIQGGLVNKAGAPELGQSGTGLISKYDFKKNGGNYIITGYFDLAPGQYSNFNVKYSVDTKCGNYLTGEWSVKNGPVPVIGDDLATTNPYYVNRLKSVCP